MDDEQLAARRAQIPVHCAACGGDFPGTTELHNGICDECHKLTHGPNYRLIARLQDQERTIARLRCVLDDLCDHQHDHPTDLSNDRGWYEAFERARALLDATDKESREAHEQARREAFGEGGF